MNENFQISDYPKSKWETKQDAQVVQEELMEKQAQIIDDAPKLSLAIEKAPFYLEALFEQDGTPKGDFRVSDRFRKKVCAALNHPHKKVATGEIYHGELTTHGFKTDYPNEYLIQATPTFLTDEELKTLGFAKRLTKKIGNIEIELVPPVLHDNVGFSERINEYMKSIQEPRRKIQEIAEIISEIETVKSKLPMGSQEVIIDYDDSLDNQHK